MGFCYLVFALTFDREIHKFCEKAGFIVRTSRGKKFEVFFICLGFFLAATIYYMTADARWMMPQKWVVNATFNEKVCEVKFSKRANYELGICQSYTYASSLFFIVGMVFGQSYSVQYVKPLLWVHTSWPLKLIRTVLGTLITLGLYSIFWYSCRNT